MGDCSLIWTIPVRRASIRERRSDPRLHAPKGPTSEKLSGANRVAAICAVDCYHLEMQSKAATVHSYLLSLPEDRRAAISSVRDVILKNLDPSYEEGMQY